MCCGILFYISMLTLEYIRTFYWIHQLQDILFSIENEIWLERLILNNKHSGNSFISQCKQSVGGVFFSRFRIRFQWKYVLKTMKLNLCWECDWKYGWMNLFMTIDWFCFYHFIKNSLLALLEALFVRMACVAKRRPPQVVVETLRVSTCKSLFLGEANSIVWRGSILGT